MWYVIACGDEGVQINEGIRLGVVGAGVKLAGFSQVVQALKQVLGDDLRIVASEENDWVKEHLELSTWEQTSASFQQQAQVVADREGLHYAGELPFADPRMLEHGIKGHMVRPHGIHIANKISFTLGGGEQKFNLGSYVISADWVSQVEPAIAGPILQTQVDFYTKLAKQPLAIEFEETGILDPSVIAENKAALQRLGWQ